MAETIWSIIALLGAIAVVGMIAYFIATGRNDRDDDEAARRVLRRARPLAGRALVAPAALDFDRGPAPMV